LILSLITRKLRHFAVMETTIKVVVNLNLLRRPI
jgi:hypothetical protein